MQKSNTAAEVFKLPHIALQSYITVPAFVADYVKRECADFSTVMVGTIEAIEDTINPHLPEKQQFVELHFSAIKEYTCDIANLLIPTKVPFHITNVFDEDYMTQFWYMMDKTVSRTEIVGNASYADTTKGHAFIPDLAYLQHELSLMATQLKMLDYDVQHFMEVRNIYVPTR